MWNHPQMAEFSYAACSKENNQINVLKMPSHYKILSLGRFFLSKTQIMYFILENLQQLTFSPLLIFSLLPPTSIAFPTSLCFLSRNNSRNCKINVMVFEIDYKPNKNFTSRSHA